MKIFVSVLSTFLFYQSGFCSLLRITFINVGHGDAALIETPSGQNILIDGGDRDQGTDTIIPLLLSKGIKKIDKMIVSNNDQDHYCGFVNILSDSRFTIGTFYHSEPFANLPNGNCAGGGTGLLDNINASTAAKRLSQIIELSTTAPATALDFGKELNVQLLKAGFPGSADRNANSNIIKILYDQVSILFAGDADDTALNYVLQNYSAAVLRSTILKVPHHGSATKPTPSVSESFVNLVKPSLAVISVGGTSFGLPDPETITVYEKTAPKLLRTDRNGNIAVITNGVSFSIAPTLTSADLKGTTHISDLRVYPNPVREGKGTIAYSLNGKADAVKVKILTLSGELVQTLNGLTNDGNNFVVWDGKNEQGDELASGLYIALVESHLGNFSTFNKARFAMIRK